MRREVSLERAHDGVVIGSDAPVRLVQLLLELVGSVIVLRELDIALEKASERAQAEVAKRLGGATSLVTGEGFERVRNPAVVIPTRPC